jgi:hypothetical protein
MTPTMPPLHDHAPAPGASPSPKSFDWSKPEFAWPLSLIGGFGGTLLGLAIPLPGLAAVLATGAFAPIFVRLQARRRSGTAYLCVLAWLVGIVGAFTGFAVESGIDAIHQALPFAGSWIEEEWNFLTGVAEPSLPLRLARNGGVFLLIVLMARPYGGLLSLLPAALVANGLGAGTGLFALRAAEKDWSPTLAVVAGSPPHLVFALGGALAVAVVLACPGPLLPLARLPRLHRRLLGGGLAVGVGALLLEPLFDRIWHSWLVGFSPPPG